VNAGEKTCHFCWVPKFAKHCQTIPNYKNLSQSRTSTNKNYTHQGMCIFGHVTSSSKYTLLESIAGWWFQTAVHAQTPVSGAATLADRWAD